jgi:hypothetical protein
VKNRRKPLGIHAQVKAHVEYSRRARSWCERAVAHREAARERQAKAAEAKAREWLAKAMRLERPLRSAHAPTER